MSRILINWELGAGYGHLETFPDLAEALRSAGHEVVFAVKDLRSAERVLGRRGFGCLQAPVWLHLSATTGSSPCFADILRHFGADNPEHLVGLLKAWRSLFDLINPDLLVFNHSPTALLAARELGVPRCIIGTGFECPPRTHPLPNLTPWAKVTTGQLLAREAVVLDTINEALHAVAWRALERFGDLFEVEQTLLCTLPVMDPHRETRPPETRYWGPRLYAAGGVSPKWPGKGKHKIFGYLKTSFSGLKALLEALKAQDASVLLHVPSAPSDLIRHFQSPTFAFSSAPIDLQALGGECDLAICHAGHGTTASLLLAGCPMLLLPLQVEQGMTAWRVAHQGLGMAVQTGQRTQLTGLIARLLATPTFTTRCAEMANYLREFSPADQTKVLAAELEQLLKGTSPR